ncbi:MAG: LacI family DNA-binding transcriptional regulator [Enterococcus sp.]
MVGIRDVARRASVSPATVSRVLNDDKTLQVTLATKQRIYQAVKDLNYDGQRRQYIKKRRPSIGVISTIGQEKEAEDLYYQQLRLAMEAEARRLHLGMNRIYNLSDNPQKWHDLDQLGAIIVIGNITSQAIEKLLQQNKHLIVVDNPDLQQEVDMVYGDLERMTTTVLQLLLANGHQDIAYLGGYQVTLNEVGERVIDENEKRLRAYRHFMEDHHLKHYIDIRLGEWTTQAAAQLTHELLMTRQKQLPSAILVGSDPMALGVYQTLKNYPLTIGKDLQIVSFDNLEFASTLQPGLTSVRINAEALGKSAVRMALERIDGLREDPIIVTYPTHLVVRESFIPQ